MSSARLLKSYDLEQYFQCINDNLVEKQQSTHLTMSLKEAFKPKSVKISTTFIDADGREKQVRKTVAVNLNNI